MSDANILMNVRPKHLNALTVDVEDAFNIGMYDLFGIRLSPSADVARNTGRMLNFMEETGIRGTFFVLGEVAKKFPMLVKRIIEEGHEVGVHGFRHVQFFRMDRKAAFKALKIAKKTIEDITGRIVCGHRAPAFSIRPDTAWALEMLAEVGFEYDSSIVPCKGRRYGWPGFPKCIHEVKLPGGGAIVEAPLSTINLFGRDVPVCGGGYLRHFPYFYTSWALRKVARTQSSIVFIHPYDIDLEPFPREFQSHLDAASVKTKVHMALQVRNRRTVEMKLHRLFSEYSFLPLGEVINVSLNNGRDGWVSGQRIGRLS